MLVSARDEHGDGLTDAELRDELMTLLVAGHETTATALTWTLERIVRHPAVLQRLQDEQRDGGEAYLDAVIKETLRLRPVVPAVVRRLQRPMSFGGWDLPAGVHIAPSIYLLHRREDLYPDPVAFRPERFLDRTPGTYEWIPFGGGVRRCLGASFALYEMRVVLQAILRDVALQTEQRGRGVHDAAGDHVRTGARRTDRRPLTDHWLQAPGFCVQKSLKPPASPVPPPVVVPPPVPPVCGAAVPPLPCGTGVAAGAGVAVPPVVGAGVAAPAVPVEVVSVVSVVDVVSVVEVPPVAAGSVAVPAPGGVSSGVSRGTTSPT